MLKQTRDTYRARLAYLAGIGFMIGAAVLGRAQPGTALSLQAQVGKQLFFDTGLSASGRMSCATCHDPANHYASANDQAVQLGGPHLTTPGYRAVPTLTYKENTPPYDDNAANPDGVSTSAPGGGFTSDGRASTLAQQAVIPLLSAYEMANVSRDAVVRAVQKSGYAALFQQAYGADVFSHPAEAFTDIGQSLQQFQLEDRSFHPYTSKYDYISTVALSNGKVVKFTPAEVRGYAVFINNGTDRKPGGNCVACHYNGPAVGGALPTFTDFTYQALGVPRNPAIPANAAHRAGRPTYYDLGLCSTHKLPASAAQCGMFKVPTLRNVVTRKVFFHNGVYTSLRQVMDFYNRRDIEPAAFYPTANGVVQRYDDLPKTYRKNVDVMDPPFGLAPGATPFMSDRNIADLICFLETLTDGYVEGVTPQDPQCVN